MGRRTSAVFFWGAAFANLQVHRKPPGVDSATEKVFRYIEKVFSWLEKVHVARKSSRGAADVSDEAGAELKKRAAAYNMAELKMAIDKARVRLLRITREKANAASRREVSARLLFSPDFSADFF
jgi:hypothetical protein